MRALDKIAVLVFNFSIIVFAIWISAIPITKSKSFYMNHFGENTRALKIYTIDELEKVADITIDYYFGNAEEYQVILDNGVALFNEDEVRHMADVKVVYITGQVIAVISFLLMLASALYIIRRFRKVSKDLLIFTGVFYGIVLILIGAFLLWGYVNYRNDPYHNSYFVHIFTNFHYLIFPFQPDKVALATGQNGYDIETLTLILNTDVFMDAGIIIGSVVVVSIILWWAIAIILHIYRHKIIKKVDEIHERARHTKIA